MRKLLLALILCLELGLRAFAIGGFRPIVSNYSDRDYSATLQNWCAVQSDDGIMYFGNGSGLLSFDGYRWQLSALPRGTIVRSLFYDLGRLYAGSFESFGYFERDAFGNFNYRPLAENGGDFGMENEEIWQICRMADKILFQSFANIYSYDPESGRVERLSSQIGERPDNEGDGRMHPLFCYVVCGHLYVQRTNGSFYRLDGKTWRRYWATYLFGSHIMGISLPPGARAVADNIPDSTLVFTQDHLIFSVVGGKPVRMATEIDADLQNSRINRVTDAPDGSIYVGTVGNGVFRIDRKGHKLEHINTSNGLQNNSVLGLCCDADGDLWTTLDDGISLIHFSLPYRVLSSGGNSYLGMGYGVGSHNGRLITATNQGAYEFDADKGAFSLIHGTKGQNWCVRSFGDHTFIGGNDQTIDLGPGQSLASEPVSGTDMKRCTLNGHDLLLQSSYYSLLVYERDASRGQWIFRGPVDGLDAPVRQIEIDADGTLWCSHLTNGVIRATLKFDSDGYPSAVSKQFYPNVSGDDGPRHCFVMKIRGRIVFTQDRGFYIYDEDSDSFVQAERLNRSLGRLNKVRNAEAIDDRCFWLSSADSYNLVEFDGRDYRILYTVPMAIFPRQSNGDNCSVKHEGRYDYFTLNEGVGRFERAAIDTAAKAFGLRLDYIGSYDLHGQLQRLPLDPGKDQPQLTFDNLTIALSHPNFRHLPCRYRFRIDDGSEIDTLCAIPMISFAKIPWGSHTLYCSLIDINGSETGSLSYAFDVPRPWFLRWWSLSLFALLTMLAIAVGAELNSRRRIRRQQIEFDREKAEQDKQIHEQSLIIAEQKRRLLESELSEKSKELASMALGAYSRQQVVENMRASLADQRRKGAPVSDAERVLREISMTDGDNRMFWDVFEKNFDLIHDHFFRNLRAAFPSLTASDLKFCALLRMNMSTKEISRFTNLSVRGVETARYRLRRKFDLPQDTSLVQFLIDFKPEEVAVQ